jgi:Arc/MetJ-type ribon-helix-helix transcriptional regulator
MERNQINMRLSEQLSKLIDAKRIALSGDLGKIPSRSDVVRLALAQYLAVDLSVTEIDRRKTWRSEN